MKRKTERNDEERNDERLPRSHKCYGCVWKSYVGGGVIVCAFSKCHRGSLQKWVERMKRV